MTRSRFTLAIGGRSVAREDPDREALDVVNHVFEADCRAACSTRSASDVAWRTGVYSATSAYADAGVVRVRRSDARARHRREPARRPGVDRLVEDGVTDES